MLQGTTTPHPAAFSVKAFAEQLSISRSMVYKMVGDGRLNIVKIGDRTLIPAGELDRIIGADSE